MRYVSTPKAPQAIGPYSQAIAHGDLLFLSGMLGVDPNEGRMASPEVEGQTEQILANIKAVLKSEGLTLDSVVKTTIFLADLNDFTVVNGLYAAAFGTHKPARSTVEVARLPLDARIEIEVLAVR